MVGHSSAQATAVLLPGLLMQRDLHSLLLEMRKQEVMPSLWEMVCLRLVNQPLPEEGSDSRPAEQNSVRARHPAERATLQELQPRPAEVSRSAGARAPMFAVWPIRIFPRNPAQKCIARRTAAVTPFPLDVVRRVIGADLQLTNKCAVRSVDTRAALDHPRLRHRISIGAILLHLRIEMSDLPIRDDCQPHPREGERAENSEKERDESFHMCASEPSASTGLRNVGTVDVRPNHKSISPK